MLPLHYRRSYKLLTRSGILHKDIQDREKRVKDQVGSPGRGQPSHCRGGGVCGSEV